MRQYLADRKAQKEMIEREEKLQADSERRESIKAHAHESREMALEYVKQRAYQSMNDDSLPLSKRIAAANEYYKDTTKPKLSQSMQEISDHTYLTKYRREMRMNKLAAIREIVNTNKARTKMERYQRMQMAKTNCANLKNKNLAKKIIKEQRAKLGLRSIY